VGEALAAEVGEEPEEKRKAEAEDEAGDDGEIKSGVFAAMNDVAGKFSQAEGEFAAEVEKSAEEDEEAAEKEEGAAKFAERVHTRIVAELRVPELEQTKRDSSAPQAGVRAARTVEKTGLLRSE